MVSSKHLSHRTKHQYKIEKHFFRKSSNESIESNSTNSTNSLSIETNETETNNGLKSPNITEKLNESLKKTNTSDLDLREQQLNQLKEQLESNITLLEKEKEKILEEKQVLKESDDKLEEIKRLESKRHEAELKFYKEKAIMNEKHKRTKIFKDILSTIKSFMTIKEKNDNFHTSRESLSRLEKLKAALRQEKYSMENKNRIFKKKINKIKVTTIFKSVENKLNLLEKSSVKLTKRINHLLRKYNKKEVNLSSLKNVVRDRFENTCRFKASCDECVRDANCVWCSLKGYCDVGSSRGDDSNNCPNIFKHLTCRI